MTGETIETFGRVLINNEFIDILELNDLLVEESSLAVITALKTSSFNIRLLRNAVKDLRDEVALLKRLTR